MQVAGRKRMTNREKKERAELKKRMQEKGILPPDKPKLNRKKFIEEAKEEWNSREAGCGCLVWDIYLMEAVSYMLGHMEKGMRLSREAVGAAKILKLAIRLRQFSEKLAGEGRAKYSITEQYEYIKDILDA